VIKIQPRVFLLRSQLFFSSASVFGGLTAETSAFRRQKKSCLAEFPFAEKLDLSKTTKAVVRVGAAWSGWKG
jgi:hypothetical protein